MDGPAGVGKSTAAKCLAARLGYSYLDTGSLYRAIAWKVQKEQLDPNNPAHIQSLLSRTVLRLVPGKENLSLLVDGQPVDQEMIRTPAISQLASCVAALQQVREWLLPVQREVGEDVGVVAEGRDMGTRVFPGADVKFFLDADLEVRANRRQQELVQKGKTIHLKAVRDDMAVRDDRDRTRPVDPLRPAPDAIMIDTSLQSVEEVVGYMMKIIADRFGWIPLKTHRLDRKAFGRALAHLQAGEPVVIFPEGTRTEDGALQPGKPGLGYLVAESQCQVIPAYISGTFKALPIRARWPRFFPIKVTLGKPLQFRKDAGGSVKTFYEKVSLSVMDHIAQLGGVSSPRQGSYETGSSENKPCEE
ncbi:MAG: (d)CMP kinase [Nitrospirales bacterium]